MYVYTSIALWTIFGSKSSHFNFFIHTQFFAIFDNFLTGIYKFLRSSKSYVVGNFKIISGFFFQILWKSGSDILVTFPSHFKKFPSKLINWLKKLNCGFFHSFQLWKNTTKNSTIPPLLLLISAITFKITAFGA